MQSHYAYPTVWTTSLRKSEVPNVITVCLPHSLDYLADRERGSQCNHIMPTPPSGLPRWGRARLPMQAHYVYPTVLTTSLRKSEAPNASTLCLPHSLDYLAEEERGSQCKHIMSTPQSELPRWGRARLPMQAHYVYPTVWTTSLRKSEAPNASTLCLPHSQDYLADGERGSQCKRIMSTPQSGLPRWGRARLPMQAHYVYPTVWTTWLRKSEVPSVITVCLPHSLDYLADGERGSQCKHSMSTPQSGLPSLGRARLPMQAHYVYPTVRTT